MRLPLDTFNELMAYHYDRREWLYRFLAEITPEKFVRPMNVGWTSIRNTLVHCLDCDDFWVQHRLLKKAPPVFEPLQYPDAASVARAAGEAL
ncbi:MAG: hypothetical protein JWN15_1449 [Firmicutes bacterium]|nr:hypothetical protein [Bacillota bacterium]